MQPGFSVSGISGTTRSSTRWRTAFRTFSGSWPPDLDYYSHLEVTGEPGLYEGTKTVKRAGYLTDLITERSLAFLDKNAKRPFFLEVSFNAPHWPFQPPGKPEDVRTERDLRAV